jgi:hypothetical protein
VRFVANHSATEVAKTQARVSEIICMAFYVIFMTAIVIDIDAFMSYFVI